MLKSLLIIALVPVVLSVGSPCETTEDCRTNGALQRHPIEDGTKMCVPQKEASISYTKSAKLPDKIFCRNDHQPVV
ncbi:unnamed protein product, partial [Mesorhabditis belari]|uniref:Uncharacterized protein n=1 Tax=Mesorhabditis belari TaxID=2138241 RepID=A0AAF3FGF7_9BILA